MTLDDTTRGALSRYLGDIRQLPNESAKTHRFSALCPNYSPAAQHPTEFAAGVEKLVRIGGQCDFPRPLLEFRRFDPI
jgi:hypothetical protein